MAVDRSLIRGCPEKQADGGFSFHHADMPVPKYHGTNGREIGFPTGDTNRHASNERATAHHRTTVTGRRYSCKEKYVQRTNRYASKRLFRSSTSCSKLHQPQPVRAQVVLEKDVASHDTVSPCPLCEQPRIFTIYYLICSIRHNDRATLSIIHPQFWYLKLKTQNPPLPLYWV